MKEPVDHIIRPSLPWRAPDAAAITECGYDASKVKALSRADFFQRLKEMGKQRCAMFTCMTCSDTAQRWGTWDDDPRLAVQREIEWERGAAYWRARTDRGDLFRQELVAAATLIEAHREEFDATMLANAQRKEWLDKKAAHEKKAKTPQPARPPAGL